MVAGKQALPMRIHQQMARHPRHAGKIVDRFLCVQIGNTQVMSTNTVHAISAFKGAKLKIKQSDFHRDHLSWNHHQHSQHSIRWLIDIVSSGEAHCDT